MRSVASVCLSYPGCFWKPWSTKIRFGTQYVHFGISRLSSYIIKVIGSMRRSRDCLCSRAVWLRLNAITLLLSLSILTYKLCKLSPRWLAFNAFTADNVKALAYTLPRWSNQPFLPERDYVTFGSLLSQFRLSVCRLLSVVCNVGAPYSGGWTFRQNFFTAVYAGHPLTAEIARIVPHKPYNCLKLDSLGWDRRIVSIKDE